MKNKILKKTNENWIENGLLEINIDGYFNYDVEVAKIKNHKLNEYSFYRFARHEISEMLFDRFDELPRAFLKNREKLTDAGHEYLEHLHKELKDIITEEIWPEIVEYNPKA